MIACWFFVGSCFVLTFYVILLLFFSFCCFACVLFLKIKLFGLGLSCEFLVFYYYFLDLSILFKRINYPVLKLV